MPYGMVWYGIGWGGEGWGGESGNLRLEDAGVEVASRAKEVMGAGPDGEFSLGEIWMSRSWVRESIECGFCLLVGGGRGSIMELDVYTHGLWQSMPPG
jgi:hypothetical protein